MPCALLIGIFYYYDVRIERWPLEVSGFPAFRDFANLWAGGIAAYNNHFACLFDEASHVTELGRRLGVPPPHLIWSYPPTALLPVFPLGMLPFEAAVAVWTIAGVFAYLLAAGIRDVSRRDWVPWLLAIAFCPGVFICFAYGQTAFLTSAALIAGIVEARRRPVIASMCLAVLVRQSRKSRSLFP
jgi:hypothetical protein